MLQFGLRNPALDYRHRATAFGVVERDGLIACVRVERPAGAYFDLPGGAVDGEETEVQALVREFVEETGLGVAPLNRITEAGQYHLKSNGEPLYNVGGFWTASVIAENPDAKCEDDHTLVWLEPTVALSRLRHDAHAWAVAVWLRRAS
ncbi:NUDIX domain-containing protein [Brevundimonas sp. SL130]|jgi:8-oxo-dGTP diphosphatase|uniref:NUDIX domain-containing protein n=1 Tax=Brevundimonas sp. SL130 TaxID=2995143 RepID=UPI00226C6F58|nr:NUDIX domain-containing protein [Brevundimonas sp. SL130]WAC59302.1 NUDIX domain-containing protein [Brevundimonas sp. SL130]